jgi:hypothetical protein
MTTNEILMEHVSNVLGDSFNLKKFFDDDTHIHFLLSPNIKLSEEEKYKLFNLKLNELKSIFTDHNIYGGKALWFGHIITIKLHPTISEQTDTLGTTCGG